MNQEKFEEGQVVWAKLGRFPWWPALIKQQLNEEEFEVEYLGDLSRSYLPFNKIMRFEDMSIPDKPGKALQQSIQNAIDIAEGRLTRDQLFLQLTSIPIKPFEPVKPKKQKEKKICAKKKKIKKIKTSSKKLEQQIDQTSKKNIIKEDMSSLDFQKKLSTSIQTIDIKVIEKDFKNFLNDIDSITENKKINVKSLMSYEKNLDYFDILDIYQSNIGVLIDQIIKELDKKKLHNLKEEFTNLKKSVTKRILSGFFEEKGHNLVESIFSDAQTDFPITGNKEERKQNEAADKKRIIFRVQKKLSKVLYMKQGNESNKFKKQECEDCANQIEKTIREKKDIQYKESVIKIINKLEKNPRIIRKLLEFHNKKNLDKLIETVELNIN